MKNKIIASRECIILGIIGFLFTLFGLYVMINLAIMMFGGNESAWYIIFPVFVSILFVFLAILSLLCLSIGAYKYWIDDSGFLHKVSIFNVDTKIPIEDIVLIMKIPACRFPEYYLLIEKRFFNQNKNIQRKQSIIICNEINNLFIKDIMGKNSKINYSILADNSWSNYCFVHKKINCLLKKAQRKNVELKISYHNYINPVESFDFENIDFIQAEMNFDGKIICEKICIEKKKR